jgi:uncharacterized protein (TIGR02996 family)
MADPELLALLAAVKEEPRDSARRLVLADWLEERGGPDDLARAEVLRLCRPGEPVPAVARGRWAHHKAAWLGPLDRPGSVGELDPGGLVCLTTDAGTLLGMAAEGVLDQECWAWVAALVAWHVQPGLLAPLASCPHLAGLTALGLYRHRLDPPEARLLAGSSHLRGVVRLQLHADGLHADGPVARAFLDSSHLPRLTSLDLGGSVLGPEGARELADCPALGRLAVLDLSRTMLGDEGAEALAASPHLAGLTALDLAENGIEEGGARALASSPHLRGLASLVLRGNHPGAEGRRLLGEAFGDRVHFGDKEEGD